MRREAEGEGGEGLSLFGLSLSVAAAGTAGKVGAARSARASWEREFAC